MASKRKKLTSKQLNRINTPNGPLANGFNLGLVVRHNDGNYVFVVDVPLINANADKFFGASISKPCTFWLDVRLRPGTA
ncbi:hypothetical protein BDP27DRAFT_1431552 [Rhodocollybia butyracea]|uniref:Uncharacterized protein n=1 Tax=Rhodocollybia butyracea TaxID=206335 RepID=A0A9P5PBP9_9AGAR|nr:hypothetical protein BDP27DRAFT_1431552 [Rhodocollybia butyracea]